MSPELQAALDAVENMGDPGMRRFMVDDHEVLGDGNTVWINGPDGLCRARFGRGGIDIHKDLQGQLGGSQCLACTHERPDADDW